MLDASVVICASCGQKNPAASRFCGACGAPLAAPLPDVRKTVTIVFCDLVGSTSLGERTDPELLRELMARYHAELRAILERHGGTVEKFVGDAAMAIFGLPQVHEDDALRAVRAAVEMRDAVATLGLEVRIGVNTGRGRRGHRRDARYRRRRERRRPARAGRRGGRDPDRLGDRAPCARRGPRPRSSHPLSLKGKQRAGAGVPRARPRRRRAGLHAADRRAVRRAPRRARRSSSARLRRPSRHGRRSWRRSSGRRASASRDSRASCSARTEARVVVGRCLSYGEGITYWPLQEIASQVGDLRAALRDVERRRARRDPDRGGARCDRHARLARGDRVGRPQAVRGARGERAARRRLRRHPLGGAGVPRSRSSTSPRSSRTFPCSSCARRDPTCSSCGRRGRRRGRMRPWSRSRRCRRRQRDAGGASSATSLTRRGSGSSRRRRATRSSSSSSWRCRPRTGTASSRCHRRCRRCSPHASTGSPSRSAPWSSADRSRDGSSIAGRSRRSCRSRERPAVGAHLLSLVRKELIRPDRAALPGRRRRFASATSSSATRRTRRSPSGSGRLLHERFADWLEARLGDDAPDEIVGYHLEQAYRYGAELGAVDCDTSAPAPPRGSRPRHGLPWPARTSLRR